jgi:Cu-Zn family superoxide dismutase
VNHTRTLIFACLAALPAIAAADGLKATADLKGCTNAAITGTAKLKEQVTAEGIKEVSVVVEVKGLPDGKHAVHIHEVGTCEPCSAAGGHHDPGPAGQSRPDTAMDTVPATDINHPFHMGDLVNLDVKNGVGRFEHTTSRITLAPGRLSVFDADGSSIIVHTQPDTYCDEESELKKGCAGGTREACGVIRLVK